MQPSSLTKHGSLDTSMSTKTTNAEDAIEAKRAFEHFARSHGVHIKHYHADNGIFNSQEFMASVESSHQTISFCGVGAHHQSGVAEHQIRELTELARTQLLHAIHNKPKAVNESLWPYALRHVSYLYNPFPWTGKTASPLELFTSSQVHPNLKQLHPFGCLVYVLQAPLPRWQERTRLGVYLGHSPYHATSVGLILSLMTGLVCPQVHCVYDDFFSTPRHDRQATSEWQRLSGLEDPQSLTEDSYEDTYQHLRLLLPTFNPNQETNDPTPESEGAQPASGTQLPLSMDSDHSSTPPQLESQQEIVPPPDPDPPDLEQPQNEESTFPSTLRPILLLILWHRALNPFRKMREAPRKMRESQLDPKENENLHNRINQDLRDSHIKIVPTFQSLYATPWYLWSKWLKSTPWLKLTPILWLQLFQWFS